MVEQVFSVCVKITILYECGTTPLRSLFLSENLSFSHHSVTINYPGKGDHDEKDDAFCRALGIPPVGY
jgi:hypothetical protein